MAPQLSRALFCAQDGAPMCSCTKRVYSDTNSHGHSALSPPVGFVIYAPVQQKIVVNSRGTGVQVAQENPGFPFSRE